MSEQEREKCSELSPETKKTDEANMAKVIDLLRYKIAKAHARDVGSFSEQEEKILELIRSTDNIRKSG